MDVVAKRPGGRHNLDTCGQPGEGRSTFSKSCGRLLWMTAKIKILFKKKQNFLYCTKKLTTIVTMNY